MEDSAVEDSAVIELLLDRAGLAGKPFFLIAVRGPFLRWAPVADRIVPFADPMAKRTVSGD